VPARAPSSCTCSAGEGHPRARGRGLHLVGSDPLGAQNERQGGARPVRDLIGGKASGRT
jgi:hypothetical protein